MDGCRVEQARLLLAELVAGVADTCVLSMSGLGTVATARHIVPSCLFQSFLLSAVHTSSNCLTVQPGREIPILPLLIPPLAPTSRTQALIRQVELITTRQPRLTIHGALAPDHHSRVQQTLVRVEVGKGDTYLTAGFELLPFGINAFVVIHVILPAVFGLVLVREAGIET